MNAWQAMMVLALVAAGAGAAEPVVISVRAVKAAAGRTTAAPTLTLRTAAADWRSLEQPMFHGENDWEVYWELESTVDEPALPRVTLTLPGVQAARVLVGKTDVEFVQDGDLVTFDLVNDRTRGLYMDQLYRSPRGGLPLHLIHNWPMRAAGRYSPEAFPLKQVQAIKNYLFAAQEVLRQMAERAELDGFRGEIVLLDTEIAATRGHLDFPAHVHIMHYQWERDEAGRNQWVSRLVPHLYMDDEGRIVRNSYAVMAGRGESGQLGLGDLCRFEDTLGNHVLDIEIRAEGLFLSRGENVQYSLRPDPDLGPSGAVVGYRGDEPIVRARVTDDAARGEFSYELEILYEGQVVDTVRDGYRYDPFTARRLPDEP